MSKVLRYFLLAMLAVCLTASMAMAKATITDLDADDPQYNLFYVAYEVYNVEVGINADNVPVFIDIESDRFSNEQINLLVKNGKVNPGDFVFLIVDVESLKDDLGTYIDISCGGTSIEQMVGSTFVSEWTNAANKNYLTYKPAVIGEFQANGVPTDDITFTVYDPQKFCDRNGTRAGGSLGAWGSATGLTSLQVNAEPPQPYAIDYPYLSFALGTRELATDGSFNQNANLQQIDALNFKVNPGLDVSCTKPEWVSVAYVSRNETSQAKNVSDTSYERILEIRPQFTNPTSTASNLLKAELNTDNDFDNFVKGSGPNIMSNGGLYNLIYANIMPEFRIENGNLDNIAVTCDDSGRFRAYLPCNAPANLTFDLNSLSPESGLTVWVDAPAVLGSSFCTGNATPDKWNCASPTGTTVADVVDSGAATLWLGITKNTGVGISSNPTVWDIDNVKLAVTGALNETCLVLGNSVGAWFGGLEVYIPFVKKDADKGWDTVIKLYNRYWKPAQLYVHTFLEDSDPILVTNRQFPGKETIPAHGFVTIMGSDIQAILDIMTADGDPNMANLDLKDGFPVKFLVRVPSQTTTETIDIAAGAVDALGGTITLGVTNTFTGTTANGARTGTLTYSNNLDPYIDGYAVHISSAGQRTVPVLFKGYKNGMRNQ